MEIARVIKKNNIKIIFGGSGVSKKLIAETILKNNKFIDIIVRGEGETTVLELVKTLEKNGDLSKVKGITYRNSNVIITNDDRELIRDLDSLPFPAYHLLPMNKYKILNKKYINIITSRGCPFRCEFCFKFVFGNKFRIRSVKSVINEIEYLYKKFDIRIFSFSDDVFTLRRERTVEICKKIIDKDLNILWTCNTRVDLVDDKLLKLMKESGCIRISYGVESGSQKTLDYLKKDITLQQIKKALKLTRENGIATYITLMVGFPHENKEEIKKTVIFAKKLRADDYELHHFMPCPNAEIFNNFKQEKIFSKNRLKTNYLSSKELLKEVNIARKKLLMTAWINIFKNSLDRIIKNPLELLKIFKLAIYLLGIYF